MRLVLAYVGVIAIWSSTPLAIVFSSQNFSFWAAGAFRMLIGLLVLLLIVKLRSQPLFPSRRVLCSYLWGAAGLLPNTLLVYWSAQFIPSGLIAVIFSLSPFFIGLLSVYLLKEQRLGWRRGLALLVAATGMAIIYLDQLQIDGDAALGVIGILGSVLFWGGSSVGLKRLSVQVDPICQTAGSLMFTVPGLILCWWVFDGAWPQEIELKSTLAVLYLAIFGSVVGFSLYFFVLSQMSAVNVSMITLIVPIIALTLGVIFADEDLTLRLLAGVSIVLFSLFLYLDIGYRMVASRIKGRILRTKPESKSQ